ncbi:MAG: sodium-translocating pyrophosphatase, partial [Elusimicrobiota bacterium]
MGISLIALATAFWLINWVMAKDTGTDEMRKISDAIKAGAEAYLRRQNYTIISLSAVLAVVIFALYAFVRKHNEHDPALPMAMALCTTASFVAGAACSLIAGYIGMWVSIRTNIRTASAARTSLNDALRIALRGGAVAGLFVCAMSLIGVGGLFVILKLLGFPYEKIPFMIVGYGFGASFVALFSQLGGGIYTKAADVGADLVGKVEVGIPEDDPRNPAVIADLVGDNVGDCAGRGADLFESTAAENIGAMILGVGLIPYFGWRGVVFPLVARALGILASICGVLVVQCEEHDDPMDALNIGYYLTSFLSALGFAAAAWWMLRCEAAPNAWIYYTTCGFIGILTAQAFVYITQYYTEYKYRPVLEIADASKTGPATNIIAGIAVGLECTAVPIIVISVAILSSFKLGVLALGPTAGLTGGLFGTAVATMGMLGTAAYILAMDTFGPITDNAGGIVEMSHQPEEIRRKTDRLDAVGNTTKALTKGYAIGSAALAAFLLFSAYLDEIFNYTGMRIGVDLSKPEVFIGAMLGAMLVFLFSALAIRAVGTCAQTVIQEVRRQFKERPGIMKGTEDPDYGQCVDIVTLGALKAMVAPGILAVGAPIAVGLLMRGFITETQRTIAAESVAAFLMVGTITGILMALFFNNAGGAWDNAKKYIEMGTHGGKKSDAHK